MQRVQALFSVFCPLVELLFRERAAFSMRKVTLVSAVLMMFAPHDVCANTFMAPLSERWGEYQWLSPYVEGGFYYNESKEGAFHLGAASFGGRWSG
ncbi:MAG: hypothetical protein RBT63_08125, partial [Bdellovibrionales bacterium]|nr:hypothetical protein [Bdellovibrionales bacterium]